MNEKNLDVTEVRIIRTIKGLGEVVLFCEKPGDWRFDVQLSTDGDGANIFAVSLHAEGPASPPQFTVDLLHELADIHALWRPSSGHRRYDKGSLLPPWGQPYESSLGVMAPVYAFANDAGTAVLSVAASEAKRRVIFSSGVQEGAAKNGIRFAFFADPEAPMTEYRVLLRFDCTRREICEAIREAADWGARAGDTPPASVPAAAFEPLYSTWYSYHNKVTAADVERECKIASKLGMKTLIVDDGWQGTGSYGSVGDWELKTDFTEDMSAHVKRVQALGMKYMIWYSVPFIGKSSRAYEKFRGKFLRGTIWDTVSVLDPRYPEVREYIISKYESAVRDWHLDGLKLDFIDWFALVDNKTGKVWPDLAAEKGYAGCDCLSVPEAVDRLMLGIRARLTAVKPDILIEFRQSYIGPAMLQYGNMIRVSDCPGDRATNRIGIANLRLTSGPLAVHSDMLLWSSESSAEDAALFILNAIFGTVQYSVRLAEIPVEHIEMMRHWIQFSREHVEALQKGGFRVRHPETTCPVLVGETDRERIIGVYDADAVIDLDSPKKTFVLNGTTAVRLVLRFRHSPAKVKVFDTFGNELSIFVVDVQEFREISVARSGYLAIEI